MSSSAKLSISCLVFLTVLYFTLQLDLAFALSIISIFILFNLPSILLFVFSAIYFFIFLISQKLYLGFDFIGDFSVASYLLFFAGMVASLWWTEDRRNEYFSTKFLKQLISHKDKVIKLAISISLGSLVYPLGGFYTSSILSYLLFCFFSGGNTGRIAVILSLISLSFIPFLLTYQQETMVDGISILIFLFLTIGIFQEFITYIRLLKKLRTSDLYLEIIPERFKPENETYLSRRERINKIKMRGFREKDYAKFGYIKFETSNDLTRTKSLLLSHRRNKMLRVLLITMLFLLVILWLVNFHFSLITRPKILNIERQGKITPTFFISPTNIPVPSLFIKETPINIASDVAMLKIHIQNGTVIPGLAASAAAKLKTAGFKNVEIGNAQKRDYKTWEVTFKRQDNILMEYLKRLLAVDSLIVNTATGSAKFDVVLIIGENK